MNPFRPVAFKSCPARLPACHCAFWISVVVWAAILLTCAGCVVEKNSPSTVKRDPAGAPGQAEGPATRPSALIDKNLNDVLADAGSYFIARVKNAGKTMPAEPDAAPLPEAPAQIQEPAAAKSFVVQTAPGDDAAPSDPMPAPLAAAAPAGGRTDGLIIDIDPPGQQRMAGMSKAQAFARMLQQAVNQMARHMDARGLNDPVIYGGLALPPDLPANDPIKGALVNYLNENDMLAIFGQAGMGNTFIDIADMDDAPRLDDLDLADAQAYNRFLVKLFTTLPEDIIYDMDDDARVDFMNLSTHLRARQLLYGAFYYSPVDSEIAPGRFYLVLRLTRLEPHPRSRIVIPVLDRLVIVRSRALAPRPEAPAKPARTSLNFEQFFKITQKPTAPPPKAAEIDLMPFCFSETRLAALLPPSDARIWGLLPGNLLPQAQLTGLMLALNQRALLQQGHALVDTGLIRSHLYRAKNRKITLKTESIEAVVPHVLNLALLTNHPRQDQLYCKSLYLAACPFDAAIQTFAVQRVIEQHVLLADNSRHLRELADQVTAQVTGLNLFSGGFAGQPVRHVAVSNVNRWPASLLEAELIDSVRLQVIKQLTDQGHAVTMAALPARRNAAQLVLDLELPPAPAAADPFQQWQTRVVPSGGRPRLAFDFSLNRRLRIFNDIELAPWQTQRCRFQIASPRWVNAYIESQALREMRMRRSKTQKFYHAFLVDDALQNARDCRQRLADLRSSYGARLDGDDMQTLARYVDQDIEWLENDKTKEILQLIRRGDIATVFLGENRWSEKALGAYGRAAKMARAVANDRLQDEIDRRRDDVERLRKWVDFQQLFAQARTDCSARRWAPAQRKYKRMRSLRSDLNAQARIRASSRFARMQQAAILGEDRVAVEKLIDQADGHARQRKFRQAYAEYEKAEKKYSQYRREYAAWADCCSHYLSRIEAGKNDMMEKMQ